MQQHPHLVARRTLAVDQANQGRTSNGRKTIRQAMTNGPFIAEVL
jgi:hypothetical protein